MRKKPTDPAPVEALPDDVDGTDPEQAPAPVEALPDDVDGTDPEQAPAPVEKPKP